MTDTALALSLHARLGRPVKGLGICLAILPELRDVLVRSIEQVQAMQRRGELLTVSPNVLADQLLAEVARPGSGRDTFLCPEVW